MATNYFANITTKGTIAQFHQAMETAPNIWRNHTMEIPSDAATETHVWAGTLPIPREFISGRNFQGIRDFTYDVANKTYELSYIIDRESMEDDRHGLINKRTAEAAEVWATFKDSQFATLLTNGDSSTETYDGTSFFDATRTIGASAALDNIDTSAISNNNHATPTEAGIATEQALGLFAGYQDDQGRAGYNSQASTKLRVIGHPQYLRGFLELFESAFISQSDNPWGKGLGEFDPLPYLTAADLQVFFTVVGSTRKPFIYQERTPLEIIVFNNKNDVAENNGVMVLCRQRYRLAYGEFRRCIEHTFT